MDAGTIRPNSFTLRFPRALEREYQRYHANLNVGYARAAFATGILLYVSFAYLDYLLSPGMYRELWTIRLAIWTPLFLALLLFMFTRWFKPVMQPALAAISMLVCISINIINVTAFNDTGFAYFFGIIIVNLFMHCFGRSQWAWGAPAGILNVVFYELSLLYVPTVSLQVLVLSNFYIIAALVVSLASCYTIEHMPRREFLHSRQLSIANAELYQSSSTDALTGLLNRRSMLERLDDELARSQRTHRTFTVAILDADHFKQINDRWGHECGDQVLKMIAVFMKDTLRGGDVLARWGGEEFLVLFPDTRLAAARIAAEQLRRRIGAREFVYAGQTLRVTVTIGLSEIALRETVDSAIRRADEALYEGKRLGRDRTIAAVAMHASTA